MQNIYIFFIFFSLFYMCMCVCVCVGLIIDVCKKEHYQQSDKYLLNA